MSNTFAAMSSRDRLDGEENEWANHADVSNFDSKIDTQNYQM